MISVATTPPFDADEEPDSDAMLPSPPSVSSQAKSGEDHHGEGSRAVNRPIGSAIDHHAEEFSGFERVPNR
jgi:hypothetical protein